MKNLLRSKKVGLILTLSILTSSLGTSLLQAMENSKEEVVSINEKQDIETSEKGGFFDSISKNFSKLKKDVSEKASKLKTDLDKSGTPDFLQKCLPLLALAPLFGMLFAGKNRVSGQSGGSSSLVTSGALSLSKGFLNAVGLCSGLYLMWELFLKGKAKDFIKKDIAKVIDERVDNTVSKLERATDKLVENAVGKIDKTLDQRMNQTAQLVDERVKNVAEKLDETLDKGIKTARKELTGMGEDLIENLNKTVDKKIDQVEVIFDEKVEELEDKVNDLADNKIDKIKKDLGNLIDKKGESLKKNIPVVRQVIKAKNLARRVKDKVVGIFNSNPVSGDINKVVSSGNGFPSGFPGQKNLEAEDANQEIEESSTQNDQDTRKKDFWGNDIGLSKVSDEDWKSNEEELHKLF